MAHWTEATRIYRWRWPCIRRKNPMGRETADVRFFIGKKNPHFFFFFFPGRVATCHDDPSLAAFARSHGNMWLPFAGRQSRDARPHDEALAWYQLHFAPSLRLAWHVQPMSMGLRA